MFARNLHSPCTAAYLQALANTSALNTINVSFKPSGRSPKLQEIWASDKPLCWLLNVQQLFSMVMLSCCRLAKRGRFAKLAFKTTKTGVQPDLQT
jgi:hypothetical protein